MQKYFAMATTMSGSSATTGPAGGQSSGKDAAAATSGGGGNDNNNIEFATFNQDCTSLSVGTTDGFKIYSLASTDKLECIYASTNGAKIVERLFTSSLMALVRRNQPLTMEIHSLKTQNVIHRSGYSSNILAVRMNRHSVIVCTIESLHIHKIRGMQLQHTISPTPPNPTGLFALSPSADASYLAYPGHVTVGELQIFDTVNLTPVTTISAHTSQLAAITFSPCGQRVATASITGTVIRVFNVSDDSRVFELRRGLARTATIYSLSFSPCGHYLACSSNTETVHVFRMDMAQSKATADGGHETPVGSPPDESWMGLLNSMVLSASATYLPTQVTQTLSQSRSFATVRHSTPGMMNICALAVIKSKLRLFVASQDGYLYIYSVDKYEGGECSLKNHFQLTAGEAPASEADAVRDQAQSDSADLPPGVVRPVLLPVAGDDLHNNSSADPSYSDRVKNRTSNEMTDSEKFHEMTSAAETPPRHCFILDDDNEFPPVTAAASSSSR